MRKIFLNEELNHQFNREGYIVLRFLDNQTIEALHEFLLNAQNEEEMGDFHTTHFTKDRTYKRKEAECLTHIFSEKLNELFVDYKFCFGSYMIKKSGQNSVMPLHADWTYVDEAKHISVSLWCPLVDTDELNGAIGVVPHSHRIVSTIRGPRIPSSFHALNTYIIEKYGRVLPMKAGEVLIYDHRLLHYSPPNLSGKKRVAVNVVVVPVEADIYHYCILKDQEEISKFNVSSNEFFIEYDHFEKPDLGDQFDLIANTNLIPTKEEVDDFYKTLEGHVNASMYWSIWKKIKALF